jgi:hypothetical protein
VAVDGAGVGGVGAQGGGDEEGAGDGDVNHSTWDSNRLLLHHHRHSHPRHYLHLPLNAILMYPYWRQMTN